MAKLVNVVLQRSNDSVPWGFRLKGGADYRQPLTVQRVMYKDLYFFVLFISGTKQVIVN